MVEIPGVDPTEVCRSLKTISELIPNSAIPFGQESCVTPWHFAEFAMALEVFQARVVGFNPDVIIMAGESSDFGAEILQIVHISTPIAIVDKVPLYQWTANADIVSCGGDNRKKNRDENRRMACVFGGMVIQQARSQTRVDINPGTRILVVDDHVNRGWKTAVSLATLCYASNPAVDTEDDRFDPAMDNVAFATFAASEAYYWQIVDAQRVFAAYCDYDGQSIISAMGIFGETLSRSVNPGSLGLYPPDIRTALLHGVISTPASQIARVMGDAIKAVNAGAMHSKELQVAYEFVMSQIRTSVAPF